MKSSLKVSIWTEDSQLRKKHMDLAQNAVVGVYKANLRGDIFYANEGLANIFEFESPEEMVAESLLARCKNPSDRNRLVEMLKKSGKIEDMEIEVFEHIRANNPRAKVILASGFLDPETKSEMYKAGAKHFIQKPYTSDDVLRKIRDVIESGE